MLDQIERELLDVVNEALGTAITKPQSIGGNWTPDELKRTLSAAPTVRLAYGGGPLDPESSLADHKSEWVYYVVTGGPTEESRRRGGPQTIGAYAMLKRLVPAIHGRTLSGIGTASAYKVDNLFAETGLDAGGAVYAIRFRLPFIFNDSSAGNTGNTGDLSDFEQFHANFDFEPFTSDRHEQWLGEDYSELPPDAQDHVTKE